MKKFIALLLLPSLLFTLFGCNKKEANIVVASCYFSYDIVSHLAKNTSIKYDILRVPGQKNIHDHNEVNVRTKELLKQAQLFIATSDRHDTVITQNFEGLAYGNKLNLFSKLFPDKKERDYLYHNYSGAGHSHEEFQNELSNHDYIHYWASPKNMVKLAEIIANRLVEIYPKQKSIIKNNLATYQGKLNNLINDFTNFLNTKDIKNKKIFYIGHDSLGYFLYDFNLKNIYDPFQKTIQHLETNVGDLEAIINEIKESHTNVIYKAELGEKDKEVATILDKLNNPNIKVLELSGYHNVTIKQFDDKVSYLFFLKQNIDNLKVLFN